MKYFSFLFFFVSYVLKKKVKRESNSEHLLELDTPEINAIWIMQYFWDTS